VPETLTRKLQEHRQNRTSFLLRIAAAFALSSMFILVKLAGEGGAALIEIMFFRQIVSVPVILIYLKMRGTLEVLKTERIGAHGARSLMGMTGMVLNFSAVILLTPAEYTTISFMTPIFAVMIGVFLYKEKVLSHKWIAVLIGFLGVVIIANPTSAHASLLGIAIGLAGALITAFINYQLQNLTRTETSLTIVFYFAIVCSIVFLPFMIFYMQAHPPALFAILLCVGIVGTIGQILMTAAMRFGSVSSILILDYTAIIWAVLYGWLIWDNIPTLSFWLGTPLIVAAGLLITRRR